MKIVKKYVPILKKEITFNVGEIPQDNFDMIDKSHGDDLWFNVQGFAIGNVVANIYDLKLNAKQLRQVISIGAIVCKQQSKYYFMSNLAVLYNKINNVNKTSEVGVVNSTRSKIKIV